eukprot:XP_001707284.1 Hypothetical protein GL50803_20769 [Giardia lamblia ATCC 50803]
MVRNSLRGEEEPAIHGALDVALVRPADYVEVALLAPVGSERVLHDPVRDALLVVSRPVADDLNRMAGDLDPVDVLVDASSVVKEVTIDAHDCLHRPVVGEGLHDGGHVAAVVEAAVGLDELNLGPIVA